MVTFWFRLGRVLIVLGIAMGIALWLFKVQEHPEKQKVVHTPPGVRVIDVSTRSHTMTVEAFGTVVPRKRVTLAAEVGGRIDYLHPEFREGGAIRSDDLLVRINQDSFILDKTAAEAGVSQAKADLERLSKEVENYKTDEVLAEKNLTLAKKEWERVKALARNQFASKTTADRTEQEYLGARIQLQSVKSRLSLTPAMEAQLTAALAVARNRLAQAELVLKKSEIRSGFDGYVLTKQAEIGEFVSPGVSLGVLYEKGALDVDVRIPLEDLKWIKELFDQGKSPRAEVTIANVAGGTWSARVARIKASIDEKTRTLPITLEIQPSGSDRFGLLKPGTFVKCRILGQNQDHLFILPRSLIHGENTLYLVRDGRLEIRSVQVIRKHGDSVFVSGGLSKGDLVVSSPLPGAADGMAVTVKARENAP